MRIEYLYIITWFALVNTGTFTVLDISPTGFYGILTINMYGRLNKIDH